MDLRLWNFPCDRNMLGDTVRVMITIGQNEIEAEGIVDRIYLDRRTGQQMYDILVCVDVRAL